MFLSMSAVTKSIPRREGYLHLRRCGSHPRGQYRAGDAPGLQTISEHSRAGNQLTEDNDKRRRIEARNTGSYGRLTTKLSMSRA